MKIPDIKGKINVNNNLSTLWRNNTSRYLLFSPQTRNKTKNKERMKDPEFVKYRRKIALKSYHKNKG